MGLPSGFLKLGKISRLFDVTAMRNTGPIAHGRRSGGGWRFRMGRIFYVCALGVAAAACSLSPSDGPTSPEITFSADKEGVSDFELIRIDGAVAEVTKRHHQTRFVKNIGGNRRPGPPRLGVGDVIRVTIWEALDAGLFTSTESRNAKIEDVMIDRQGAVFLPYAGRVKIAGKTVEEARRLVQAKLEQETLRPQVEIRMVEDQSYRVAVTGTVDKPGLYPLKTTLGTAKLVEVITAAGGSKVPAHRTDVIVVRKKKKARINLDYLYKNPASDIYIWPRDKVILEDVPKVYSILGAVNKSGQYEFTKSDFRLIDALSFAGGLSDQRANKTGVFLFRFEDVGIVNRMRAARNEPPLQRRDAKTVYQLNLQEAQAFFFAQQFQMLDGDVVFVTNAPIHEWNKILNTLAKTAFVARTGIVFAP